jgi:Ser/Thr protein kinase RdoA (MazF antagonist)
MAAIPARLDRVVRQLLPDADLSEASVVAGQFHEVVLLPQVAAIRVTRHSSDGSELDRCVQLSDRLSSLGLPFAVPRSLSDVTVFGDRAAVAVSWIPGGPGPRGAADPAALRLLLDGVGGVALGGLRDVLGAAHAYAGGTRWYPLLRDEAVPLLPRSVRSEAMRRIEAVRALPDVPVRLVHGDLAGANVHWDSEGRVVGVLDWDLASPWDPAVDAACLAYYGWDNVRAAVDAATYQRARVRAAMFGIEQLASAVHRHWPPEVVEAYVQRTAQWIQATNET